MMGPDKKRLYPNEKIRTVCYISNLPKRDNVEIGEYTYYSDTRNPRGYYGESPYPGETHSPYSLEVTVDYRGGRMTHGYHASGNYWTFDNS